MNPTMMSNLPPLRHLNSDIATKTDNVGNAAAMNVVDDSLPAPLPNMTSHNMNRLNNGTGYEERNNQAVAAAARGNNNYGANGDQPMLGASLNMSQPFRSNLLIDTQDSHQFEEPQPPAHLQQHA